MKRQKAKVRFVCPYWFEIACLLFVFFMVAGGAFLVHDAVEYYVKPALSMIGG